MIYRHIISLVLLLSLFSLNNLVSQESKMTFCQIQSDMVKYGKSPQISPEDIESIIKTDGLIDAALKIIESNNDFNDAKTKLVLQAEYILESHFAKDERATPYLKRITVLKEKYDTKLKEADNLSRIQLYLANDDKHIIVEACLIKLSLAIKKPAESEEYKQAMLFIAREINEKGMLLKFESDYSAKYPEVYKLLNTK